MSLRRTNSPVASEPAARPSPKTTRDAGSGVIRALCVDDHAMLVEGLKAQFELDGGIEIVGRLSSASRLVEEIDRLKPDVVLLDIEMPGADAFEMADRARRAHSEVRIIVLSAHIRDAYIGAAFAAGICAYFAKSDELEDIVRGIHQVTKTGAGSFVLGPKVRERCRPGTAGEFDNPFSPLEGLPATRLGSLTTRETEILRMIGKGLSRVQIAEQLCRSPKTIDGHQERMMKKLKIEARADLMRFAIREGLAQA